MLLCQCKRYQKTFTLSGDYLEQISIAGGESQTKQRQ